MKVQPNRTRAGISLIEALMALTLLVVMIMSVGLTSQKVADAFDEGNALDAVNTRAHRSLERILRPLEEGESSDMGPQPLLSSQFGANMLTYHTAVGFAGGIQWSDPMLLQLELEEGELNDGADNDGDGLIDEGVVILTQNWVDPLAARRMVICRGVAELLEGELANGVDDNGNGLIDEQGLSFQLDGDVLNLRMTVQTLDPGGRILTRTVESSIVVRN